MTLKYRFERQFGIAAACISGLVALWLFLDGNKFVFPWVLFSLAMLLLALAVPRLLRPLAKAWMLVGHVLGYVNTRILLAIVFYLVITPLSLLFRLTGRDVLALKHAKAKSYWLEQKKEWPPQSFKNQF